MSKTTLQGNVLFNNFVAPNLCKALQDSGLTPLSKFTWKSRGGELKLLGHTELDPDGYYVDAEQIIDKISPPDYALPAYTITDLEAGLDNYCLSCTDGMYQITLPNIYNVSIHTCQRMADAFAYLMLEVIRKKVIDLAKVNNLIEG